MLQRCLLISDDLTGGADAGAQFAKIGLNTLLIWIKDDPTIDFSKYDDRDVLVVNTDSRGINPAKASFLISNLLKNYDEELFPIVYKKIDSTLRGNIGYEIDAILQETNGSLCFMAPSYPEQNRTLVDGILMVGGKPLALTETSIDTVSPVRESHVQKLLEEQSTYQIGGINLPDVASGNERLQKVVAEEQMKGNQLIIFDAMTRQDLTNIADVAFRMSRIPLLAGSAGLAEEVAKKLSPSRMKGISDSSRKELKPIHPIFMISGSVSSVTHEQLNRIEKKAGITSFQISKLMIMGDEARREIEAKDLSLAISKSLAQGHVLLKTCPERLLPKDPSDLPVHLQITKALGQIVLSALEASKIELQDLTLVLTGGDTALGVIHCLEVEGIKIDGEVVEGIAMGHLIGGKWHGIKVITKAGGFGKEDALRQIMDILGKG